MNLLFVYEADDACDDSAFVQVNRYLLYYFTLASQIVYHSY